MAKYQEIQNALKAIGSAEFQELGDYLLKVKNPTWVIVDRPGSQTGKRKTTKGTPDTVFQNERNKYILVEYSTNISDGIDKIMEDIEKCLNQSKTGLLKNEIEEIIVCYNFSLKASDHKGIISFIESKGLNGSAYSLDELASEIYINFKFLAKKYLDLSLDTGQVVDIDTFVNEYNRATSSIAAPLDNCYINRDVEQIKLKDAIDNNDIVLLTGKPGVGKTRLALEVIRDIVAKNISVKAYCISYKYVDLIEDLNSNLSDVSDIILFVDDANRITEFKQIISYYTQSRKKSLKIVITVRDYAFTELKQYLGSINYLLLELPKLNDEEIKQIITGKPFEIRHSAYYTKIVRIADGNPRVAIMAANLALNKQTLSSLNDLSDLFERYYSLFELENELLLDNVQLRCLGVISFFGALRFDNDIEIKSLLVPFGVTFEQFNDSISYLSKKEIVDIYRNIVKISEQNTANYYFYRVFIKEQLLDFSILLTIYFNSHRRRLRDCIIPANNIYGYERVMQRVLPFLSNYWNEIKSDVNLCFEFLDIFWLYLQSETIEFLYCRINEVSAASIINSFEDPLYNIYNKITNLLDYFLSVPTREYDTIILLTFNFLESKPANYTDYVIKFKKTLGFNYSDFESSFYRQKRIISSLISFLESNSRQFSIIGLSIIEIFLSFSYESIDFGGKNKINISTLTIGNENSALVEFRKEIWDLVSKYYVSYPDEIFNLLKSYSKHPLIKDISLLQIEAKLVLDIIDNCLDASNYYHCKYVYDQIDFFKSYKIYLPNYDFLLKKFNNKFLSILTDIDKYSKSMYNVKDSGKVAALSTKYIFSSKEECLFFIDAINFIKIQSINQHNLDVFISYVLNLNFINYFDLGSYLLEQIMTSHVLLFYNIESLIKSKIDLNRLLPLIKSEVLKYGFWGKPNWLLRYIEIMDISLLTNSDVDDFLKSMELTSYRISIDIHPFLKIISSRPSIIDELFQLSICINSISFLVEFFHFEKIIEIEADFEILKSVYLQQVSLGNDYLDHDKLCLKAIISIEPEFLVTYTDMLLRNNKFDHLHSTGLILGMLWEIEGIQNILLDIFETFYNDNSLYLSFNKVYLNAFFVSVKDTHLEEANNFLITYLKYNYSNERKVNMVLNIVEHSLKELKKRVVQAYVSLNKSEIDFFKLNWLPMSYSYSGRNTIGQIKAKLWKEILIYIEQLGPDIDLIPIISHIKISISNYEQQIPIELERDFLSDI